MEFQNVKKTNSCHRKLSGTTRDGSQNLQIKRFQSPRLLESVGRLKWGPSDTERGIECSKPVHSEGQVAHSEAHMGYKLVLQGAQMAT